MKNKLYEHYSIESTAHKYLNNSGSVFFFFSLSTKFAENMKNFEPKGNPNLLF